MKKIYLPIIILIAFFNFGSSQSIELQLVPNLNCDQYTYCVTIQTQAVSGANFDLGTSSMLLNYDPEVLAFRSYSAIQFTDFVTCNGTIPWAAQKFDATSRVGDFELTLTLNDESNSCPTVMDFTPSKIGQICFDIIRQGGTPNVYFDASHTQFNSAIPNNGDANIPISKMDELTEAGVLACDCPGAGAVCDDQNVYTINDQFNADCHCAGEYLDNDEDGILDGVDPCQDQNYEAENATLKGNMLIRNSNPQFSGLGYVDYRSANDTIEFEIDIKEDGDHTFYYRYATEVTNSAVILFIDGNPEILNLKFPLTGDWWNWDTLETKHYLTAGMHTVSLKNIFSNGINLDQLIISHCTDCQLVGQVCDDGNDCTTDDVYDANCNCGGKYEDTDLDGVCNVLDVCEGGVDNLDFDGDGLPDDCDQCDNNLIGTTCDDGNPCTENDFINTNCECTGTFVGEDSDNDGVCDTYDICPDGDDNLDMDGDGTPDACDPCDDRNLGMPCDDGDPCTLLDIVISDCGCQGIFFDSDGDGVCNAEDLCDGHDDTIDIDGDGMPDACDPNIAVNSKMEYGVEEGVSQEWRTVHLTNSYTNPVVVATVVLPEDDLPPVVTRIQNAVGNSFELRVQNPSDEFKAPYEIHYFVAEAGVYNEADHGIKMEAVKANAELTANAFNWVRETRTYLGEYSNPVVLGQVMTFNDEKWSVFWASAANSQSTPPDSLSFAAGKTVCEDSVQTREIEEIGYIVFESGTYNFNGINIETKLGANTVAGVQGAGTTGYSYDLGLSKATRAVLSSAGMNGGNGGWPVLFGEAPFRANAMSLAFDEDQINDTERSHITEEIAYIAFESVLPFSAQISSTDVLCNGENNGTATADPQGGLMPYTYKWSNGETTQSISNLAADTYEVTVTDANGTAFILDTKVNEPPVLTGSVSGENISCFGLTDGNATASFSGGSGNLNYFWNNDETDENLENLAAGIYSVTVLDENNCFEISEIEIIEPEELAVETSGENLDCFNDNSGTATASFEGGTGNVNFEWSNGETTQIIQNVSAGIYSVIATDENGCTAENEIEITQPNELIIETEGEDVLCHGDENGSATATFEGGTGSVNFEWSTGETGEKIENLGAGIYTVTATDQNGCSAGSQVEIAQSDFLTVETAGQHLACFGDENGSASATFEGGTGNISLEWNTGETTEMIENLKAGIYEVIVTDENGCSAQNEIEISQPDQLEIETTGENVLCFNDQNGSANATFEGGTGTVNFEWSNGESGETIQNLNIGIYTVIATDENGCTSENEIEITQPNELLVETSVENLLCFGDQNGTANATFEGGTGTVIFEWSNGETGDMIENLSAGIYEVVATDENGCSTQNEIEISQPDQLEIETTGENVLCFNNQNGTAIATFEGGTGTVIFEWSNGESGEMIENLSAGIYEVVATDENGCSTQNEIEITQPDQLEIETTGENVLCFNDQNGTAIATSEGGTGTVIFEWSNGESGDMIENLSAGIYEVVATDENGCSTQNEIEISQPDQLEIETTGENVLCFNDQNGTANATFEGGTGTVIFEWSNGETGEMIDNLGAGIYEVVATDENGCSTQNEIEISQPDQLIVETTVENVLCFNDENGSANATFEGGTGAVIFEWSNGESGDMIDNLGAGIYEVVATDENGCSTQNEIEISQPDQLDIQIDEIIDETATNSDGSISVSVSGGVNSNYTFEWYLNGNLVSNEEDLTNVSAGEYTLEITDENGCVATEIIVVESITSVFDIDLANQILIKPNPNNGEFFVEFDFPESKNIEIMIFDHSGKMILPKSKIGTSHEDFRFDLTAGASGVYLMKIIVEDTVIFKRIAVTR